MALRGKGRIEQGFALGNGGILDGHVHDVGSEAFAGKLKRTLGPCGRLEEKVDLGAALENGLLFLNLSGDVDGLFGKIENGRDVWGGKPGYTEQMAMRKCHVFVLAVRGFR